MTAARHSPSPWSHEEFDKFREMFGITLSPSVIRLALDRFPIHSSIHLAPAHEHIDGILDALGTTSKRSEARVAREIAGAACVKSLLKAPPSQRGEIASALVERCTWILHNAYNMGRIRQEHERYAGVLRALATKILEGDPELPLGKLARCLTTACKLRVFDIHGLALVPLMRYLAQDTRRPVPQVLKQALRKVEGRIKKATNSTYAAGARERTKVDGMELIELVRIVRSIADLSKATTGRASGGVARARERSNRRSSSLGSLQSSSSEPLIDPTNIPTRPLRVNNPNPLHTGAISGLKRTRGRLELEPLARAKPMVNGTFGVLAAQRLCFQELLCPEVVIAESKLMTWSAALSCIRRASRAAAAESVTLMLSVRSVADAEPTGTEVRRACAKSMDDEAYRIWLKRENRRRAEELSRASLQELTRTAQEASESRDLRTSKRMMKLGTHAYVVAATGCCAALPTIYGVGGHNASPMPVEHAVVLGRWSREFGARPVAVRQDALVLDIARPPATAVDIAWAGMALRAYCPEIASASVGARESVFDTWNFWWD